MPATSPARAARAGLRAVMAISSCAMTVRSAGRSGVVRVFSVTQAASVIMPLRLYSVSQAPPVNAVVALVASARGLVEGSIA